MMQLPTTSNANHSSMSERDINHPNIATTPTATTPRSPTQCQTILPLVRVRNIMRSSPDAAGVAPEGLYAMTRAAELFIMKLAKAASDDGRNTTINYEHLAKYVQSTEDVEFLQEIIPYKVKVCDIERRLAEEKAKRAADKEESSEESSDSD